MKFQKSLLAFAVLGAMSSVASASTIGTTAPVLTTGIPAYASGFTIASELLGANYDLDLGAATTPAGTAMPAVNTIRWVPTFGLNSGDVLTFTLSGGRYMGSDVKLCAGEAVGNQVVTGLATDINGDADTTDFVEVASNFGTVDATNGVTSVQVRINNALNLPTNIQLQLSDSACTALGGATNPTIRIPTGTSGNVTIASSATTSGGLTIPAAAASATLFDIEKQIAVSFAGGTSVIDVAAVAGPRLNFVEEGAAGDILTTAVDTDLTQSAGALTINNDADSTVEDFHVLVAGDLFTATLSATSADGLSTAAGANFFELGTGTANDADQAFTLAGTTLTSANIAGTSLPARGASVTDDVVLTVNGTTALVDRTVTGSAALNFTAASRVDQSYAAATTHTWTTNGTVLHAPYVSFAPGFNNRFVLTNTSGTPAAYSVQVQTEAGATFTASAALTGTIPANGNKSLLASDLGAMSGTTTRAAFTFTVQAPTTAIQGQTLVIKPGVGVETSTAMMRPGTN